MAGTDAGSPHRGVALVFAQVLLAAGGSAGAVASILRGSRPAAALAAMSGTLALVGLLSDRSGSHGRRRRTGAGSRGIGPFWAYVLTPVFESSILLPLAWVARAASPRVAALALVGVGLSYVALYERAKGEGLGYAGRETAALTTVRAGLLVLGLLSGWFEAALWGFVLVAGVSASVRAYNVIRQERHDRSLAELGLSSRVSGTGR